MRQRLSYHIEELLELLNNWGVECFVVGGLDTFVQVEPEETKDLDIWVNPAPANATRVFTAFAEYTDPITTIDEAAFADPQSVLVLGGPPNRIMIRKSIPGLDFDTCWKSKAVWRREEPTANVLSLEDLITAKLAAGRPHDLPDVSRLRKALELEERWRKARESLE